MEKIRKLYPGTRTMYTPNGIDTADWEALPSERKFASEWRTEHLRGEICLGVFGQIKEKKGIEVLLSCLLQERRAGKFHLMLAGDYDQDFETRLAETGLKFSLLPFLDRNELVKYYAACDGVVISSHYDGMPNVLLEAGALGIPVLASSAGGIKDVMSGHPLLEAYMFYPGDDEKLGSLLDQFQAMSSDDRQLLGNILKEHIIRNYNTENEIKPYIELLSYEKNKTPSVS
jgi:glycosyltransferase involved in cell wall biosynthesis